MTNLKATIEVPKLNAGYVSVKIGDRTITKFKKNAIVSVGVSYDLIGEKETNDTIIAFTNGHTITVNEDLKSVTKKLRIY